MELSSKIIILASLIFLHGQSVEAQKKEKVIYKYKKHEKIDLGSLEIQGQIIAPGDLSIEKRSRKVFVRDLWNRPHFKPEIKEEMKNLR